MKNELKEVLSILEQLSQIIRSKPEILAQQKEIWFSVSQDFRDGLKEGYQDSADFIDGLIERIKNGENLE